MVKGVFVGHTYDAYGNITGHIYDIPAQKRFVACGKDKLDRKIQDIKPYQVILS